MEPRVRVLLAHVNDSGKLARCVLANEEYLPMPVPYVIVGAILMTS